MSSVHPVGYTQKGTHTKFNTTVQLDPMSKADLLWWQSLDRTLLSNPTVPTVPSVIIETDASRKGWGAVLNVGPKQEVSGQQRRGATKSIT